MSEVGATMSEYYLGTESFINRLVTENEGLAKRVVEKLKRMREALRRLPDAEARREHKRLVKAENLYLKAAKAAGNMSLYNKILAMSREEEEVDREGETRYNYIADFKFKHKNFPTENESQSEAHRLAVWWARRKDVEVGDRTLISMRDRWYVVEKFDDAENHYQVEMRITKAEFNAIYKEIKEYGRSGQIKSVQRSTDFIDKLNKSSYSTKIGKSGAVGNGVEYRGKDNQIQRMDKIEAEGREQFTSNGNGDSKGSGSNQQRDTIRYSFKNSKSGLANDGLTNYNGELRDLIEERGDYIIDSYEKLRDIVNLAFDEPNTKATAYFGIIDTATLEKIKDSISNLPKELEGTLFKEGKNYSVAATLDSIRHIVDEKSLTREDVIDYLDRLADTIVEFDSVDFNYHYHGKNKMNGIIFKKDTPMVYR